MHHDGMHYYPIDQLQGGNSSSEGLLVMNHEYIAPRHIHSTGPTYYSDGLRPADEVRKEIAAHGVSVVHIRKDGNGEWDIVFGSPLNRRITGATEMEIQGPLRGYHKLETKFSPDGTRTRGTLNNCSMGPTPWGTYLTAEENWHGYFCNDNVDVPREQQRHGVARQSVAQDGSIRPAATRYDWEKAEGQEDQYLRFNVTPGAGSATDDYRNEVNTFGFMVEINPFNPQAVPQKRTALGRFGHEGVIFAPAKEGEPIVCYPETTPGLSTSTSLSHPSPTTQPPPAVICWTRARSTWPGITTMAPVNGCRWIWTTRTLPPRWPLRRAPRSAISCLMVLKIRPTCCSIPAWPRISPVQRRWTVRSGVLSTRSPVRFTLPLPTTPPAPKRTSMRLTPWSRTATAILSAGGNRAMITRPLPSTGTSSCLPVSRAPKPWLMVKPW